MDILKSLFMSAIVLVISLGSNLLPTTIHSQTTPKAQQRTINTQPASSQDISRNWSGYTATNGTFTGISATWTIPQLNGNENGNYGADATWIGIGGVTDKDLIQAGTQQELDPNGQVSYQAFFETLPVAMQPLDIPVNGGDSVTVSLRQTSQGQWNISFHDNTNGKDLSFSVPYDSSLSSADWIEEAPTGGRRILPLDNFGTVTFTNAQTIKDGQSVNLAQTNARAITMGNFAGAALATTSTLADNGNSFSVTRSGTESQTTQPVVIYRLPLQRIRILRRHRIFSD